MTIQRIGQFVGPSDLLGFLGDSANVGLARIKSYQNDVNPKVLDKVCAAARGAGVALEAVFDAAHGGRYLCFTYRTQEERAACWSFLTRA